MNASSSPQAEVKQHADAYASFSDSDVDQNLHLLIRKLLPSDARNNDEADTSVNNIKLPVLPLLDQPNVIVVGGLPGSGKDSVGERIAASNDSYVNISTGNAVRNAIETRSERGRYLERAGSRKDVLPDGAIMPWVLEKIREAHAAKKTILLNGLRSASQFQELAVNCNIVACIYLDCGGDLPCLTKRIAHRKMDAATG